MNNTVKNLTVKRTEEKSVSGMGGKNYLKKHQIAFITCTHNESLVEHWKLVHQNGKKKKKKNLNLQNFKRKRCTAKKAVHQFEHSRRLSVSF